MAIEGMKEASSLDRYASIYVPLWLRNVNLAPAQVVYSCPTIQYDHDAYVASFAGRDVFQEHDEKDAADAEDNPDHSISDGLIHLARLKKLLSLELDARERDLATYNCFDMELKVYQLDKSLYQFTLPGIREYTPPVDIGDIVRLRQIRPLLQSFTGYEYAATVWGVNRVKVRRSAYRQQKFDLQGLVVLKIENLILESMRFNVIWVLNRTEWEQRTRSIGRIYESMKSLRNDWAVSNLFPAGRRSQTKLSTLPKYDWNDPILNLEQKKAVQDIVERQYGNMPFLVVGPPGTGKTKTLVEAILQVLAADNASNILVCAPSNTASDTLALRLSKCLKPDVLFRLNSASRSFAEVPDELMLYSLVRDERFTLPSFRDLMKYRVVVGTLTDIGKLIDIRCTNRDLARLESFMANTIHRRSNIPDLPPRWSHLFLDEAGQASEPETYDALVVMEQAGNLTSIVLAGDHKQLGPRIVSDQARTNGLDESLFERLINRDVYAKHPQSRGMRARGLTSGLPCTYPAFCHLNRNYRSHPAILMMPSLLFYDSSLSPCALNVDRLLQWKAVDRFPIHFHGVQSEDEWTDEGASWYNVGEALAVKQIVQSLTSGTQGVTVKPADIAVLTPFREQVWKIRKILRAVQLGEVGVGTVEDYQGAEHRVTIISVVRSREKFLHSDIKRSLGLLFEPKRMNVAVTRCKELLCIVGNPHLMLKDPYWRLYLSFCSRNNLYRGTNLPELGDDLSSVSAMEKAYQFAQDVGGHKALGQNGTNSRELHSMLLASFAAEQVLREEIQ